MTTHRIATAAAALGAVWIATASPGCTSGNCPPVECNIAGLPDLADEALTCASRAVDGGNGVAYWLLPLSPIVTSDTGVLQYVLLAANTSDAAVSSMLADASGEWFYEPDDGAPVSIKTMHISVGPNIEAGPNEADYYVGTLGVWGSGVPQIGNALWVNLRLELQDNGRTATFRLRLPVREERDKSLDADCWRAISMHHERPVRAWAAQVTSDLLRARAED